MNYFKEVFGLNQDVIGERIHRVSVRGLAYSDKKVLMIKTNRGDLLFPGGGINSDEQQLQALKREVKEESGYQVIKANGPIGELHVRKMDRFEPEKVFEQITYYYHIDVSTEMGEQVLDAYEHNLDFTPVWIEPKVAIELNEKYRKQLPYNDYWIQSELYILNEIIRELE